MSRAGLLSRETMVTLSPLAISLERYVEATRGRGSSGEIPEVESVFVFQKCKLGENLFILYPATYSNAF